MYFANNSGLVEFDGTKWVIYAIKNYTNVRSLFYDETADRIYAGAFNEFGYYSRDDNGRLQYHSLSDKISNATDRVFNEIWHINKFQRSVYFQGDKEIFIYSDNKISKISFSKKIDFSTVVENSFIISTKENGPSFFNGSMFVGLPGSDILKGKKICSILPFQKNKILFVTELDGLFLFDGTKVITYSTDIDEFLKDNQVFCAAAEGSKIAFGTVRKGLVVKDIINNQNIFSNRYSGLQNNTILSLAFDRQHNLWLGLDKGIDYVLINSPIYDLFGDTQLYGAGYSSLIQNNTLYLGTNQGLYATPYPVKNSAEPQPIRLLNKMQGQVWSLCNIDNTIFCGTDHGAYMITKNMTHQIPGILGTWGFRKLKNHPGYILGSSYQGFFILKKTGGSWILSNFLNGFDLNGGSFEEDEEGYIWFNHWIKGIYRIKLNNNLDAFAEIVSFGYSRGMPTIRDNSVNLINGKIVFSTPAGFYRYDKIQQKAVKDTGIGNIFVNLNNSSKLHNSAVYGSIWCTAINYIGAAFRKNNKYELDTLSFRMLKDKLIFGFENFNFINEKEVIVSTEDGFALLDLSKITHEKNQLKVSIRAVLFTNENDSLVNGYISPENSTREHVFSHKNNSIKFEFVAPDYRNESAVTYSYFLENFDSKWSAFSPVNTKEYTKLRKGTYTFRVRAKSLFEKNTVETSYVFTISPPWYDSQLAYFIYLVFMAYVVLLYSRYIKRKSEEGARKMKAVKELEMKEKELKYEEESRKKKEEIIELKNQKLEYELRHKSQELANSTMNVIRKNEMLLNLSQKLNNVASVVTKVQESKPLLNEIHRMQSEIKKNIEVDNNWKRFAENFDLVYENYLKRLGEQFPQLTNSDKKLCAYLKMDLSSKEIAPLLNISFRSVEMSRHRLRKKLELKRDENLTDFLQRF